MLALTISITLIISDYHFACFDGGNSYANVQSGLAVRSGRASFVRGLAAYVNNDMNGIYLRVDICHY